MSGLGNDHPSPNFSSYQISSSGVVEPWSPGRDGDATAVHRSATVRDHSLAEAKQERTADDKNHVLAGPNSAQAHVVQSVVAHVFR